MGTQEKHLIETILLSTRNTSLKIVNEYDQEIPQSQTADNPVAPRGRAAQAVILPRGDYFSPYFNIVLICVPILVLQEYWALTEIRIGLKPVLGGLRIVAHSINSHEQTE